MPKATPLGQLDSYAINDYEGLVSDTADRKTRATHTPCANSADKVKWDEGLGRETVDKLKAAFVSEYEGGSAAGASTA